MAKTHPAAISAEKGSRLTIVERATPEPGPNDILIEVKAVALNPIDYAQRDFGLPPVPVYPAVLGIDAAGVVVKVGSAVTGLAPGARVFGLVSSFFQNGVAEYGSFQKYALARSEGIIPLPDSLSFEEGAIFPLGLFTALTAWTSVGISLDTRHTPADKEAVLIWGGASSVGTFAIQTAKILGFTPYVTASPKHHEYLKKLGAHAVFDYRADDVISQIVDAVKKDGVNLRTAHGVVDTSLEPVLEVIKQTKGDATAKVASSAFLAPGHATLENTEIAFTAASYDEAERNVHIHKCFHEWLAGGLKSGSIVASPSVQVEAGGLEGLNAALDKLKAGVSGVKIVVPF
ncbi:GroES-like protein [Nemania sp. NC0429]|nr:GroES-like protein [Nemania sp. NC0429]